MNDLWKELHDTAKNKLSAKEISDFISIGNNSCAILSSNNNIYSGCSIISNSEVTSSAEKSAVIDMFNNKEYIIKKMVILNELEEIIMPSINSISYLLELNENFGEIEILVDIDKGKVTKLKDLIPSWWGTYRNKKY